ncbi:MAG: hypothetical protein Q9214_003821 [Letrouitia sp. 1 TL-2023]
MDYAGYFTPPVQQYSYYGLPATRPEHPYTPQEDQATDPMDSYGDPNNFIHQQHPPPPPPLQQQQNHHYDQHQQPYSLHPQSMAAAAAAQTQSPPHSLHRASFSSHPVVRENSRDMNGDFDMFEQGQGRSSDDEKDNLTPAQSRRKAQNRAAQRAFRERKERHVKDLEGKLDSVTAQNNSLLAELERLRRENEKFATQNEILRLSNPHQGSNQSTRPQSPLPGPMHYSPNSFHTELSSPHHPSDGPMGQRIPPITHRIDVSPISGEKLYSTGATWDFIQNHEIYRKGMVDISEVSQRLQGQALCNGSGPAFPEGAIVKAIEDSVGTAGDELI